MIETDHQITCDKCEDDGKEFNPIHSQEEFGPVTITEFRRRLGLRGWVRANGKDLCPDCAKSRRERRSRLRYTADFPAENYADRFYVGEPPAMKENNEVRKIGRRVDSPDQRDSR